MSYVPNWRLKVVEVPITIGSLDAYTANDVVGGLLTSDEIPQLMGGGYIAWVRLIDDADQKEPFELYLFYETPSTIADDAEFTPTEADWAKCFTVIEIAAADYDASGGEACAFVDGKDKFSGEFHIFPNLSDGKLRAYLKGTDTGDYAEANDLTLHLGIMVM